MSSVARHDKLLLIGVAFNYRHNLLVTKSPRRLVCTYRDDTKMGLSDSHADRDAHRMVVPHINVCEIFTGLVFLFDCYG